MQNVFHGLGIALITPFKEDGSIDYDALVRLVEYQLDNGADFFCILATTGEAPCLTQAEKNELTAVIKRVVKGRVPILKYCGGNNTEAVVDEIKATDWSGIDGILSICPYYNKPSQEGLFQHFKAIAQVSPLPVVMYYVPGRSGVN
ncbi:MAG: dihydrodipicolinate synthase family protein, partial [Prevotella denticola]